MISAIRGRSSAHYDVKFTRGWWRVLWERARRRSASSCSCAWPASPMVTAIGGPMARRCGAPTQDPPSFFNRNDRPPFIAEGTDLLARQRHDSDAARRFEARVGLDWAIDHGCRPWL